MQLAFHFISYACEVWGLKGTIKNKLMVFGRKVLEIIGPKKEREGTWRIKTNDELIRHKNKSHKVTMFKLVWPFTTNAGREREREWYPSTSNI